MVDNSSVVKNENENLSSAKFDEQTFLIHNFKDFVNPNEKVNYKNFVSISGEPSLLINKILGTGIDEMFQIKPHQLSLLQPKIRLYKVIYDLNGEEKNLELIFNDFYKEFSVDELLKSSGQRGFGIGLKSFDWEDMGTNPGDTGVAFKSTLVLHAQSLEDIFREQLDKETNKIISFVDLIRVPPKQFTDSGVHNEQYFRIKVELGWQIPSENLSLFSEELLNSIRANNVTLFLTLTDHNIDLREDGTATFTINYIGAIEGKMLSPETDILYIDANIAKNLKNQEHLLDSERTRLDQLKTINDKKGRTGIFGRAFEAVTGKQRRSSEEIEEESLNKEIEERNNLKENIFRENKALSYKRFLTLLEKKGKIFYVDIGKEEIQSFQKIRDELSVLENVDSKQLEKFKADKLQQERLTKKSRFEIAAYKSNDPENPIGKNGLASSVDGILKQKDEKTREKILNDSNKRYTESRQAKNSNKIRINYIYFGDIIDTALEIIKGSQNLSNKTFQKSDIKDNFRFLLGPVELGNSEKVEIKNLADIPISIDLFNNWFLKKVVRPQLDKYLLRDFMKDICSELVIKAISSDPLGPYIKATRNRVSFSVFSLGSSNNDPFGSNGNFGNLRLNLDNIEQRKGDLSKMRQKNIIDQKHYFMIYVSGQSTHKLSGNYENDSKNGVYHLFFGADRGIVKKISFSKTDMSYVKESRIVNQDKNKKGDIFFVEPYNASLDLWGTCVFKPGMCLYIDPKSIGMPKSIPKEKRIPLGGYYSIIKVLGRIEPGRFESTISLNWESSGEEATIYSNKNIINNNTKSIDSVN